MRIKQIWVNYFFKEKDYMFERIKNLPKFTGVKRCFLLNIHLEAKKRPRNVYDKTNRAAAA